MAAMCFRWDGELYARISSIQEEVGDALIRALSLEPGEHVLDVGCGTGDLSAKIARQCSSGQVVAIDASESMISEAIARSRDVKNLSLRLLKVEALRSEHEFDVVYSNSAFHWVHDTHKALAALHKALKITGRIGLQFPLLNERHPLVRQMNELIDQLGYRRFYAEWESPWFVTTKRDFLTEMGSAGFKNVVAKQQRTKHHYGSSLDVYDFYSAVGLECYLEPLGRQQNDTFRRRLKDELSLKFHGGTVELEIDRIFALGAA